MIQQDESLNVNAKNVDEAIAKGLAQLGLTRNQVDIQILKEGRRGVFGIGAEDAVVRLTRRQVTPPQPVVEQPKTIEPPPQPVVEDVEVVEPSIVEVVSDEQNLSEPTPKSVSEELPVSSEIETDAEDIYSQEAVSFLTSLLNQMGVEAMVTARLGDDLCESDEEPSLVLDITGKDLGILIGRRNATLRALQYMVRLAVNKDASNRRPILIDVEAYRVRRRQSLRQLAMKMAEQAVNSRKRVVMESMSAYERRIVHVALRDNTAVRTKSIGGNDNRKVTIIPK